MFFKNGDCYIEVDEDVLREELDVFEIDSDTDLEDTVELPLNFWEVDAKDG